MDWEKVYRDLRKLNLLVLLISSFTSYLLMDHAFTMGILIGGLMITVN